MKICLYVTNFKNDLVEAISKTAVDFARVLGERATCVLYTPGEIAPGVNGQMIPASVNFASNWDYHSKIRVVRNIMALGRHLRTMPNECDIHHFYVGNLLELFLIRLLLPKLGAIRVVTVWQPYLGIGESLRLLWTFRSQLSSILHHYLFNSWPLIPLFWLGGSYFDRIVVHTNHQKKQLFFFPEQKIQVIENGVPRLEAARQQIRSDPPRVLYVGHATAVKGLDVLLSALRRSRNRTPFAATLALSEFQNIDVRKLIAEHGLDDIVTVKGQVDVVEELRRHDVVVIPHKTSIGTSCYPNIALEAFSVGIPIIASETEILAEIMEHRVTGLLVPPGDVGRLHQALVTLLDTPEAADGMVKRQKAVFETRFTLNRYVERYLQMYGELQHAVAAPDRSGGPGRYP